jgi:hypothetical protein
MAQPVEARAFDREERMQRIVMMPCRPPPRAQAGQPIVVRNAKVLSLLLVLEALRLSPVDMGRPKV